MLWRPRWLSRISLERFTPTCNRAGISEKLTARKTMTPVTAIQKYNPPYPSQGGAFHTVACMIATDVLTLFLSVSIAVICKVAANPSVNLTGYLRLWPFLFVFIAVYASAG